MAPSPAGVPFPDPRLGLPPTLEVRVCALQHRGQRPPEPPSQVCGCRPVGSPPSPECTSQLSATLINSCFLSFSLSFRPLPTWVPHLAPLTCGCRCSCPRASCWWLSCPARHAGPSLAGGPSRGPGRPRSTPSPWISSSLRRSLSSRRLGPACSAWGRSTSSAWVASIRAPLLRSRPPPRLLPAAAAAAFRRTRWPPTFSARCCSSCCCPGARSTALRVRWNAAPKTPSAAARRHRRGRGEPRNLPSPWISPSTSSEKSWKWPGLSS